MKTRSHTGSEDYSDRTEGLHTFNLGQRFQQETTGHRHIHFLDCLKMVSGLQTLSGHPGGQNCFGSQSQEDCNQASWILHHLLTQ